MIYLHYLNVLKINPSIAICKFCCLQNWLLLFTVNDMYIQIFITFLLELLCPLMANCVFIWTWMAHKYDILFILEFELFLFAPIFFGLFSLEYSLMLLYFHSLSHIFYLPTFSIFSQYLLVSFIGIMKKILDNLLNFNFEVEAILLKVYLQIE